MSIQPTPIANDPYFLDYRGHTIDLSGDVNSSPVFRVHIEGEGVRHNLSARGSYDAAVSEAAAWIDARVAA